MKRRGQLSLELLLLLAAYFAFLAVFVSASKDSFARSFDAGKKFSSNVELEGTCFFIDFFSLDGAHSVVGEDFSGFSSSGRKLFFGNGSAECFSEFRFENGLKVKTPGEEPR
ncbi:MAG: hypothetical protein V1717_00425 [Candidatus Micrarchaeota archaeon]